MINISMPFILETDIQSSGTYKVDPEINSRVDINMSTILYSMSDDITYLASIEILYRIYRDKIIIGKQMTKAGAFVITSKEEDPEMLDDILMVKTPSILYDYARKKIKSFWILMDYPPFAVGDYNFKKSLEDRKILMPNRPLPIALD
ncbi:protein-export chaperone SecB [Acidithiobacillus thiooxidans]|uniref:protein-export chaperone SecB n=1 Tax=Acidithiobacillus thiooxidans TaxID=930 RepID=UPI00129ED2AD|nr:protein-export chaperone SecB [Acidithiobacillus thiooxidans]